MVVENERQFIVAEKIIRYVLQVLNLSHVHNNNIVFLGDRYYAFLNPLNNECHINCSESDERLVTVTSSLRIIIWDEFYDDGEEFIRLVDSRGYDI